MCNTLTITSIAEGDEGSYYCKVQNSNDPQYDDISDTPLKLEYCSGFLAVLNMIPSSSLYDKIDKPTLLSLSLITFF